MESSIALALLAAVPPTLLFVAANSLEPIGANARFPLSLLAWAIVYALVVLVPAPLLAIGIARKSSFAWLPRAVLAVEAAWLLFAALWLNRDILPVMAGLEGAARFRWLVPAAFASVLLAIGGVPLLRARGASIRILTLVVLVLTGAALFPASTRPAPAEASIAASAAPKERERTLLIGLDGADWKYLEPLIAQGDLPNLARLRDGGAWGPLTTVVPT
ncbi:MAG: alkaline phosphatase family protein, partial [Candidatus Binatia bacterium]